MPQGKDSYSAKIDLASISPTDAQLLDQLVAAGQSHLFEAWDKAGVHDDRKLRFLGQLRAVDSTYPGGISSYLERAQQLLASDGTFSGLEPGASLLQPDTIDLTQLNENYRRAERRGLEAVKGAAFVLVAGGLGERLGYSGIKMEIPVELTTQTTYLGLYCRTILAMQDRVNQGSSNSSIQIPFLIMTSGGTCEKLKAHLQENEYFGLSPDQLIVFEQRLVPSLADADARLATNGPYELLLKPGGHGDVHAMLHQLGLAKQLAEAGKSHLVFIQDTNAQIVNLILPALGESVNRQFDFTFVAVPRVPKEPIGAVVRIAGTASDQTINIEYNQLEALFDTQGMEGDQAAADGYSPYPGNINLLITRIDPYLDTLDRTQGSVAEFINPKFADGSKTKFAKPTRVESLMQDVVALYPSDSKIGVAQFNRQWALAAMKNNINAATSLANRGQPDYSAAAAESGFYQSQRIRLRMAGAEIPPSADNTHHGVPFREGARVVLSPSYSLLLDDADGRLKNVFVSREASLVLDGNEIILNDVRLEGSAALVIHACEGAHVRVEGLHISQPGYTIQPLNKDELEEESIPEFQRVRGFKRVEHQPVVYTISEPGDYTIRANGQLIESRAL